MSVATGREIALDVHGLQVMVRGDWPEVVDALRLDFTWFESDERAAGSDIELEIQRRPPDYERFGELEASFVTPRNVVYQLRELTVVDYFGRAVSVLNRAGGWIVVQGEDEHLVHEAAYLFLLSRVGEHLDASGFIRLHALGLSAGGGAVAIMLPSGGGKTTLALRALREPGVKLLSEDTPLLDRQGRLHPFPLRIGVNETDAASLPPAAVRRIERMEFHPKLALDLEGFRDRIETEAPPLRDLVIGRRSLGRSATLERAPRSAATGPLLREAVVGVGVYQGMEFVLQRGMRDVLSKSGVAVRRAVACTVALQRARVWRLTAGRDQDANWNALLPLLR